MRLSIIKALLYGIRGCAHVDERPTGGAHWMTYSYFAAATGRSRWGLEPRSVHGRWALKSTGTLHEFTNSGSLPINDTAFQL